MQALRSQRLLLEPQTVDHAAEMFGVLADPAIYRHENTPPPSLAWLTARFARLAQRRSPDGAEHWLNWVVRLAPAGPAIGYVQATLRADGSALVAYVLNSRHWGRGYASEAVQALLDELAARWGVRLALAVLKRDNLRSLALLRRLGFQALAVDPADADAAAAVEPDECLMARPLACPGGDGAAAAGPGR